MVINIGLNVLKHNRGKKRAGNCISFQLISRLQSEQRYIIMCSKFLLESCCRISEMYCYGATANAHQDSNLTLFLVFNKGIANAFLVTVR